MGYPQEVQEHQECMDLLTTNAYEVLEGGRWELLQVAAPIDPQLSFRS